MYLTMGSDSLTRFKDDFIQRHFGKRIEAMTGQEGGGFLFDTNTIHKGDVDGRHHSRDVVVVELLPTFKAKIKRCPNAHVKIRKQLPRGGAQ